MFDKLQTIETRYDKLMALVSDAAVQADPNRYRTHAKALTEIQPIVETFRDSYGFRPAVTDPEKAEELIAASQNIAANVARRRMAAVANGFGK